MKRLLFLLVMIFCAIAAEAQISIYADGRYTNRLASCGDYIYVAADCGLARYDKVSGECVNYTSEVSMAPYSKFTMLFADSRGRLFMSTEEDGVYCYVPGEGTAKMWMFGMENTPDRVLFPFAATETPDGDVVYSDTVFYIHEDSGDGHLEYGSVHFSRMAVIMDMEYDSSGNLWIATSDFISPLVMGTWKGEANSVMEEGNATSMVIDGNDCVWLTCDNGIKRYDIAADKEEVFLPEDYPGMPGALYVACDMDDDGNIWFVSSHYLLKYDGTGFASYTCYGFNEATSVLCDGDDVWVYSADDKLIRFTGGEFTFVDLPQAGITGVEGVSVSGTDVSVTCSDGTVYVSGAQGIKRVNVYDIMGRCVRTVVCSGGSKAVAELYGACTGICLVEILHGGGRTVSRVIVD